MGDTPDSAVLPGLVGWGGGQGWYSAVGQLGLGRMEEGADTHVMVVLSNCSARLSMADDCKYGSSLSVCLSVRCVSVLASPIFVLCGYPCPAHALLRLPTWSISVVPILVLPAWHWLLAGICPWPHLGSGGGKVLDRFAVPGCGEVQGLVMGWEGTAMGQCHVIRDSQTQADPTFLLRAEGKRGRWRHEQGEQCMPGSQGCSS